MKRVGCLGRSTLLFDVFAREDYVPRNRMCPTMPSARLIGSWRGPKSFKSCHRRSLPRRTAGFDWLRPVITPHDGLIRPDHPMIRAIIERTQSASSLQYAPAQPTWICVALRTALEVHPNSGVDPLVLDAPAFGRFCSSDS